MPSHKIFPNRLNFIVFFLFISTLQAHNGAIALAYPVRNIKVDASFSDWPDYAHKYEIRYSQNGFVPENSNDIGGYFRIGYSIEDQAIYVAVEITDDIYIRNKENPEWWAHDMQVLYIDPRHERKGSGVLALEVNEYLKKIVGQEENWDPLVKNAHWDQIEVQVLREGNTTFYEWKITLDGYIKAGKSIGFDYVVFDKDGPDEDTQTVGWGMDSGVKHQCFSCLGDVLLLPTGQSLATVSGNIGIMDSMIRPKTLRIASENNNGLWVETSVDSLGDFRASLPPGPYKLSVPNRLKWEGEKVYRVAYQGDRSLLLKVGKTIEVNDPVSAEMVPSAYPLPEKGLLYGFGPAKEKEVDSFVKAYMAYYGIPGVSLSLIKNGKVCYTNTYGVQNMATGRAVTAENLFEAASITKPVFAYVVNRLAERKIIDMDTPLHEYLSFGELENDFPEYKKMTARHVLAHQSGLPNWGRQMLRPPGTAYGYSGEGFEYLKRVVMEITGKPIETVIREELIGPLKLAHMEFSASPYLTEVAVNGHIDEIPTVQSLPSEAGMAWSMYTEARAFSDFVLALYNRIGLRPETFVEMMTIQTEFPEEEKEEDTSENVKEGMGLGIALSESKWGRTFEHGGNNGDFKCLFKMYEDLGMGFVIFTNSNTGDFLADDLAQFLVEGKAQK